MALILNIDTATSYAGVCLSKNARVLAARSHQYQKDHASFLQPSVEEILKETNTKITEIDAVAVTGGPGSYTGIRVGLASAKGICYALNRPLIILNTLSVIAQAAIEFSSSKELIKTAVFYPMIDARRLEVFGGIYSQQLFEMENSRAIILDQAFIDQINCHSKVIFCGDGAKKLEQFILPNNYSIINSQHTVNHMINLSERAFQEKKFANLAYAEPLYIKDFYQPSKA